MNSGEAWPKPLADDPDRHPGLDRDRGVSVTQVVEPDPGQVGFLDDPLEGLGEGPRIESGAVLPPEHVLGVDVVTVEGRLLPALPIPVRLELGHGLSIEVHSPSPVRLGTGHVHLATDGRAAPGGS